MGIFDKRFLGEEKLRGLDNYKYSCIDNSPIAVYISHPFWNWFVQFYPIWLAPNVLTFGGAVLLMGSYWFVALLDYDLSANRYGSPPDQQLPEWFWLMCSLCTFAAHLLDGTDGKQARRTGSSGPTGELFDHGLDSWSTVPFTVTIFSVFGQGGAYSLTPIRLLGILISVQLVFIVTHWEKYNTGVLFLSWGYDASQYGLSIFYLVTYFIGHRAYQLHVFDGVSFAMLLEAGFYLCCVLSFVMSFNNLYHCYYIEKAGKQPSLYECMVPMIAPVLLFASSWVWASYSPTHVIDADVRLFCWTMGVVFSHTAVHLIIAQMSQNRAQPLNKMLLFYMGIAAMAVGGLFGQWELVVLKGLSVFLTLAHLHFGICVVRELCDHFNINAFSLRHLQQQKHYQKQHRKRQE